MTEDQLAAIEARHHSAQWTLTPSSQISTCDAIADIPALVAEVRRIMAQVEALAGLVEDEYLTDPYITGNPVAFEESEVGIKLAAILAESEGANGN